ncbi:MAG: ribokinase [Gammaproteobacteria bacterium]|nr:ribokinase [Gammaproteobacteria bacterium]
MSRLINFGSLCIDWVYQVPNLVAAGETISSSSRAVHPGGKGLNQSIAAALAGADVLHFGAVGDDGAALLKALDDAGVDTRGVVQLEYGSGHALIQVDSSGRNAIVIYPGANRSVPQRQWQSMFDSMQAGDWLLLQNETNDIAEILTYGKQCGTKMAINLAPADERISDYPIQHAALLIVNEIEAMALAATSTVKSAFVELHQRYPDTDIVLTLGGDGLWCAPANQSVALILDSYEVAAVDETAAGDAFIGYLMAALLAEEGMPEALMLACAAGALAVTQAGAASSLPSLDKVEALRFDNSLAMRQLEFDNFKRQM